MDFDIPASRAFYFSPFLHMPAREAHYLKLAYKKPMLAFGDGFNFPGWDCSLGSARLMLPRPFLETKPGAQ